jgi:hypothetical protein
LKDGSGVELSGFSLTDRDRRLWRHALAGEESGWLAAEFIK